MKKIYFCKLTFMLLIPFFANAEKETIRSGAVQRCQSAYQKYSDATCPIDIDTANAGLAALTKVVSVFNKPAFQKLKTDADYIGYFKDCPNCPNDFFTNDTKSDQFTQSFCNDVIESYEKQLAENYPSQYSTTIVKTNYWPFPAIGAVLITLALKGSSATKSYGNALGTFLAASLATISIILYSEPKSKAPEQK
jgi:hypothetical protein